MRVKRWLSRLAFVATQSLGIFPLQARVEIKSEALRGLQRRLCRHHFGPRRFQQRARSAEDFWSCSKGAANSAQAIIYSTRLAARKWFVDKPHLRPSRIMK
jgi:hypothetical protein